MNLFAGVGLGAATILLSGLMWSIAYPTARVWPPPRSKVATGIAAWILTVIVFATALLAGLSDWNHFGWPAELRWSMGLPLIILGNVVVWAAVAQLGLAATSGEKNILIIDGFYRFSRNPQYVADVAILVGWFLLSASLAATPVVVAGIAVLLIAPLAEEPWMEEAYGDAFDAYRKSTRRYL